MAAGKKRINLIMLCLFILMGTTACNSNTEDKTYQDIISYDGKEYALLEYNADIFSYHYNNSDDVYMEVDETYPVECEQWDMVICNEDLYVEIDKYEEAQEYYSSDANYEWYFTVENEDTENKYPVNLTDEEIDYVYGVEELEKDKAIFFEEIEKFGVLEKNSKDGILTARTDFVLCEGDWYWKSEIIDENKDHDGAYAEYVQKMPDTLNEKLKELE